MKVYMKLLVASMSALPAPPKNKWITPTTVCLLGLLLSISIPVVNANTMENVSILGSFPTPSDSAGSVEWHAGSIWVIDAFYLYKYTPKGELVYKVSRPEIASSRGVSGITSDEDGNFWIIKGSTYDVTPSIKIDPKGSLLASLEKKPNTGNYAYSLAYDGQHLWTFGGKFHKREIPSGAILQSFTPIAATSEPKGLAWDSKTQTLLALTQSEVYQVTTDGLILNTISLPKSVSSAGDGDWDEETNTLWLINEKDRRVYQLYVPPTLIKLADGAVTRTPIATVMPIPMATLTPTNPPPTIPPTTTPTPTPTVTKIPMVTTTAKATLPTTQTTSPATSSPAVVSVSERTATVTFPSIATDQYTSIQIPTEKEQAVSKIALSVKNSVSNAALEIETMQSKPDDVKTEVPGKVYRYLSISPQNIQSSDLYSAEIGFKIEKSWITSNNIDQDAVALYRYKDGQWNMLSTDKLNEDFDYIYYSATTSGFSIFAISALPIETGINRTAIGIVGLIVLGIVIILFTSRTKKSQIEIRRTVYDPVTKDFVSEKKLSYPEVSNWLSAHPPPDYWYILRIDNHGSTVEQWAVELETQKAVSVKEAYIDGNNFTSLLQKEESSMQKDTYWKNRYIFTVPKEKGQTLPSNGVRRLYFRLNIDCNVVLQSRYTIAGRVITKGITPIPEKGFPFSCDIKEIKKIHAKEAQTVEKYITDRAKEYEPIKRSHDKDDMRRAAYYCCELFLLHLNLQKAPDALKYCLDMLNYASGKTRKEVEKLAKNLEFKVENHNDISEDFLKKAEVIVHQVRMGWE
jgi:PGF-pre-PGF domain-containing protein